VAFALFRYFDAAKPGPVAWADQLFKGFGWRGGLGHFVRRLCGGVLHTAGHCGVEVLLVTAPSLSKEELLALDGKGLEAILIQISAQLLTRGWMLATAESCTGGMIAAACTDLAGSSQWFERGFVTYSNAAKTELLGVPAALIAKQHGAVSEPVARAMARRRGGAIRTPRSAVAVTGVAGPTGGSADKPVGMVWFGFSVNGQLSSERQRFDGDRAEVRRCTSSPWCCRRCRPSSAWHARRRLAALHAADGRLRPGRRADGQAGRPLRRDGAAVLIGAAGLASGFRLAALASSISASRWRTACCSACSAARPPSRRWWPTPRCGSCAGAASRWPSAPAATTWPAPIWPPIVQHFVDTAGWRGRPTRAGRVLQRGGHAGAGAGTHAQRPPRRWPASRAPWCAGAAQPSAGSRPFGF
jgi:nicotinamide-nucleotide amidase